ncbi:C40 family peptidase [Paenibacillus jiagnxiensis]|uniref:C40 family peptidase n=1 Tax=Paenibacillus jiagnxiensis TaxID=3228926 RepID=UPI0033AFB62C
MLFRSGRTSIGKMMIAGAIVVLLSSACASSANQQTGKTEPARLGTKQSGPSHIRMMAADGSTMHDIRAYKEGRDKVWLPVKDTMQSFNFKLHQGKDGGYLIGDTDPVYAVHAGKKEARAGDRILQLPEAPKQIGGRPYMTSESLSQLLGTNVQWDQGRSQVRIYPPDNPGGQETKASGDGSLKDLALTATDRTQLISYGEKFSGTPYEFGAPGYAEHHTFDCSSFVQYVFNHFNVELPRTSISQSEVGTTVAQQDLQQGDLMFFYTPGRYETNRTVGHVGIYAGNNKILHTYGDPGVTVTDFDDYWKGRFLFAKRVQ